MVATGKLARMALQFGAPLGQDIPVIAHRQGHLNVLLDQQDRETSLLQLFLRTGERPSESSSIISTFGSAISPRATATICCSPPLNVPAF